MCYFLRATILSNSKEILSLKNVKWKQAYSFLKTSFVCRCNLIWGFFLHAKKLSLFKIQNTFGIKSSGIQIKTHLLLNPKLHRTLITIHLFHLFSQATWFALSLILHEWFCFAKMAALFSAASQSEMCIIASLHVHVFAQNMASTVILY